MRRLALAGALLVSLGIGGYYAYDSVWGTGSHLREARSALASGDLVRADVHLKRYLEARPGSIEGHLLAARTARRALVPILPSEADGLREPFWESTPRPVDSLHKAEEHLQAYERLGGPQELAELERFLARAQFGDLPAVEKNLQALSRQDMPEASLILEALAIGYMQAFRLPEARNCLDRWLGREETVRGRLWRGWVENRLREKDKALADYRRVVELAPDRDEPRLCLAELLLADHQANEAFGHLEELRRRHPDQLAILLGLAKCLRVQGKPEEARPLLDRLLDSHRRSAPVLIERARLALSEQQSEAAESWLRQALAAQPSDRAATYLLIQCLSQQGKDQDAHQYRARLKQIDADLERIVEVSRAVMLSPHDPALRTEAGEIFLRNAQEQQGLHWLQSALHEDPIYRPAHRLLADHYQKNGQPDLAAHHRRLAGTARTVPLSLKP